MLQYVGLPIFSIIANQQKWPHLSYLYLSRVSCHRGNLSLNGTDLSDHGQYLIKKLLLRY